MANQKQRNAAKNSKDSWAQATLLTELAGKITNSPFITRVAARSYLARNPQHKPVIAKAKLDRHMTDDECDIACDFVEFAKSNPQSRPKTSSTPSVELLLEYKQLIGRYGWQSVQSAAEILRKLNDR